jgi:hypothetical protein
LLRPWSDDAREATYNGLRLLGSPVATDCHDGSLAACRAALGMLPPGSDSIARWYGAAAQRALVRARAADTLRDSSLTSGVQSCVRDGVDSSCSALVRERRWAGSLTYRTARQELLRRALVVGGPEAFARLRTSGDADAETLLAHVAGVPADSLVAGWRRDVLTARAPAPAPSPQAWLTGLGTLLVAGLIATRWRQS